jgi:hypothetical protein
MKVQQQGEVRVQQQGEVRIERIDSLPNGLSPFTKKTANGDWIISHSENGNHHCLPGHVDVMERHGGGVKILYAIVQEPGVYMFQDALAPHEKAPMEPGIYEMRVSREYDPWTGQAAQVLD